MKRPLQVYVEEAELEALDRWATERGWTKSEAVRAAVRALTRGASQDPILDLEGMVQSGLSVDATERFEEHLSATFVAERGPAYERRSRSRKRST